MRRRNHHSSTRITVKASCRKTAIGATMLATNTDARTGSTRVLVCDSGPRNAPLAADRHGRIPCLDTHVSSRPIRRLSVVELEHSPRGCPRDESFRCYSGPTRFRPGLSRRCPARAAPSWRSRIGLRSPTVKPNRSGNNPTFRHSRPAPCLTSSPRNSAVHLR